MKSGRYFFILFLILLIMPAYAQKGVDITGTVIEEGTNEPIEQATVRLLSVKDSSMIGGIATSRNGSFMLKNIKNGSYLLHVSFVGFDPLYQPLRVTGKTNPVKLGKLALTDGAIQLGEAVVIGKAPEVTVRNDTMEYNADSYKTTEGSMLEDLLKNYERVCDHCSNVAVAQIEVAQDSFDTHAYLNELRHGNDTKESEEFHRRLDRYRERYLFPENQSAEDFDK